MNILEVIGIRRDFHAADESDASVVPGVELASLQTSRALSDPPIARLGMYIKIKAALPANSFKKRARE